MAITGGIKFFSEQKNKGATAVASGLGQATVDRLLDSNRESFYRSSDSDDTTTEEIEIVFLEEKLIDRLFLIDFNGKEFNIKYDDGGSYVDFSNVKNINGDESSINESSWSEDTYYAEFTPVTTQKIRIQIIKTQIADEEKYINQVVATEEIATLVGYPINKEVRISRNLRSTETISGKRNIQTGLETFSFKLQFKNYPSSDVYNIDIDVMMQLLDSEKPFLVWLCGGRSGKPHFNYTIKGYRLRDLLKVKIDSDYNLSYLDNIYVNPVNLATVDFQEHN